MRSRCSRPKPRGLLSLNADAMVLGGLFSGRHIRSPVPVQIASPSESWTSGRQSTAVFFTCSLNQYIELIGARPNLCTSLRMNSAASTSMTTPLPRCMTKR
ncbi:Multidrug efflux pump subunit AcrA [Pseudomonas syringae pv. actinidiae]|uniref:Multidrug efflux pump subunit AcrA n=1 Tax=Pseudomonas syringae pv. actinidiae TaxID=103796 RepID=A0A2V0QKL9_PSESF|nr:Multidrug efflux pump subunit AcrA [Pseudomonas syringae pv. actinidiae]